METRRDFASRAPRERVGKLPDGALKLKSDSDERGKCWAASLCGCEGPITPEHLASKSLFSKRIRIEGGLIGTPARETSIKKLRANILCQKHNNELGRTADAAALKLYRHLMASHQPMDAPGSRILRPPVERRVCGVDFGRWLCKTHCNFMVAQGMHPDQAYVRYAFLRPPGKPIYFYLAAALGERSRLAVVSWRQLFSEDHSDFDGAVISLAGFSNVLTTVPTHRNGLRMVDRIRAIERPTPLGPFESCSTGAAIPHARPRLKGFHRTLFREEADNADYQGATTAWSA